MDDGRRRAGLVRQWLNTRARLDKGRMTHRQGDSLEVQLTPQGDSGYYILDLGNDPRRVLRKVHLLVRCRQVRHRGRVGLDAHVSGGVHDTHVVNMGPGVERKVTGWRSWPGAQFATQTQQSYSHLGHRADPSQTTPRRGAAQVTSQR